MYRLLRSQRLISRLAIFVMLAAVLFPVLGNAFAQTGGGAWMEVCTSNGVELRAVSDGDAPVVPGSLPEHCAYCLAPTFGDVLPVFAARATFSASAAVLIPSLSSASLNHSAWPAAHPRGPPLIA